MLAESRAACARESAARRRLHNLVQELRGNIRVFVRVKPADPGARGPPVLACEDGHRITCTAGGQSKARKPSIQCSASLQQRHLYSDDCQCFTPGIPQMKGYKIKVCAEVLKGWPVCAHSGV